MERLVRKETLLWASLAASGLTILGSIIVAILYASIYGFFHVPFSSWFVFILLGLPLVTHLAALWFRCKRPAEPALDEFDELVPVTGVPVTADEERIVATVFRDFPDIACIDVVDRLPGGYGGSNTLEVRLQQSSNLAFWPRPFVIKLGDKTELRGERDKFFRYVFPTFVQVSAFFGEAEWGDSAGIAYLFAGQGGRIKNLHQLYDECTPDQLTELVRRIYLQLDKAWYSVHETGEFKLFEEYHLLAEKMHQIATSVASVLGDDTIDGLLSNSTVSWSDPVQFLEEWQSRPMSPVLIHRSTVHGDLNSRNVLIEHNPTAQDSIWFIDFSHTGNGLSQARTQQAMSKGIAINRHKGHTLRDFSRLEADVKCILTRLYDQHDLELAVVFERELMAAGMELCEPSDMNLCPQVLQEEKFKKAWQVIREIRLQAQPYLVECDKVFPYYFSLFNATLPIVYYQDEQFKSAACARQQKRYALVASAMLCHHLAKGPSSS